MSQLTVSEIKQICAIAPEYNKIIPSMANTVSFLMSIFEKNNEKFKELLDLLIEFNAEIIVKFEADKITDTVRKNIFQKIYNQYKEKNISINYEKYNYSELGRFGNIPENIDFLLEELNNEKSDNIVNTAVELLGFMKCKHRKNEKKLKLLEIILSNEYSQNIRFRAINSLIDLELNYRNVVNEIVSKIILEDGEYVRAGIYYLLSESNCIDENIDVIIKGLDFTKWRNRSALLDEHHYLWLAIRKIKSPNSLIKIYDYLKKNIDIFDNYKISSEIDIFIEKSINLYNKNNGVLECILDLTIIFVKEHKTESLQKFVDFFVKTNTRIDFIKHLFDAKTNEFPSVFITKIVDEKCFDLLIEEFCKEKNYDYIVKQFMNNLKSENVMLFNKFYNEINKISENKFILPPERDYKAEQIKRRQKDFDILFDRDRFIAEVKLIYDTEKKEKLSKNDLMEISVRKSFYDHYYVNIVFDFLRYFSDESILFDDVFKDLNNNWNNISISQIYNFLFHNKDIDITITEIQKKYIENWCLNELPKINFKTAFKITDKSGYTFTNYSLYLCYFLRKFKFTYPPTKLIEMLLYDCIENSQFVGIQYLEDFFKSADIDMDEAILNNLKKSIKNYRVLLNHLDYCKRHNINDVVPYAKEYIIDPTKKYEIHRISFEILKQLNVENNYFEEALLKINNNFKWQIVEYLIEIKNEKCRAYLQNILNDDNDKEKYIAAKYLIELQDLKGLSYFVEYFKKKRKYKDDSVIRKSPLYKLNDVDALPYLIDLLELTYQKGFNDNDYHSLKSQVLNVCHNIAVISTDNYKKVKNSIEEVIKKIEPVNDEVRYLDRYLESLEKGYYSNIKGEGDIKQIINKVNTLIYGQTENCNMTINNNNNVGNQIIIQNMSGNINL